MAFALIGHQQSFLNDDLIKIVFMNQLQRFINPSTPDYVCLLKKSLYAIKKALKA